MGMLVAHHRTILPHLYLDAAGSRAHRQVDGGVTSANAGACVAAGADALVAGTAVFRGGPSAYAANIQALKAA